MRNCQISNAEIICKTDVLIVGSGPAGISAAMASSRMGVKTLIVEGYGCLGGALSVVNIQSYTFGVLKTPEVLSAIPKEIVDNAKKYFSQPDYRGDGVLIDSELYKCFLDDLMKKNSVEVLLHCRVCGTIVEDNVVIGVYVCTKTGIKAILAKKIVDATGDGDVAFFAGANYLMRDKKELQPVTVVFGVSGIDTEKFNRHNRLHPDRNDPDYGLRSVFRKAAENGEWDSPKRGGAWKSVTDNGDITSLNITASWEIDATDISDITFAEITGRKQVQKAVCILNKYGSDIGFGNCRLRNISPQLGVRETRRIEGEYILREQDVINNTEFEDSIGRFVSFMDTYDKILSAENKEFSIPYRILLPKNIDNILVAGRCVSCDHISFGALRLMPCCSVTGQAAGTAAALSTILNVTPKNLDIGLLQNKLIESGVRI